ncbi:MAG TPA: TAXI family TRAP transporter solute-binding subunit [Planctomycetes bacterium]|nr:TAXI family TRAP transporter solute-binding subunit [Planctomycetota bacterium]
MRFLSSKLAKAALLPFLAVALLVYAGCSNDSGDGGGTSSGSGGGRRQFLSMGTAPVGGAFNAVGQAVAEVLNANKGDANWKMQAKGTKGSQENIRRLSKNELQLALANSAITYFAVRGESGWEKKYDMRAIATLAPNVAMFITMSDSGIKTIADLKGKKVVVGPAGAGFEMFVQPLLSAHGVTYDDFSPLNATQNGAVDLLGDGSADAAFLGGAIPTSSISQACSTHDIHFIPFGAAERTTLVEDYPFFQPFTITKDKYTDLTGDYDGLNVGSMQLITSADQDEELIYEITKLIWEHRADIAAQHPAGKAINEKNAARNTGTEFHPGAVKFYKEIGIWPEADSAAEPAASSDAETTTESAAAEPATQE